MINIEVREMSKRAYNIWTYDSIRDYINGPKGNGCTLLSKEEDCINSTTKILIKCSCGEEFVTTLHMFRRKDKPKQQCNECGRKKKCFPYNSVKHYIESFDCKLITKRSEYKNGYKKIAIKCRC